MADVAKAIKAALAAVWLEDHPLWTATLHVDDDYMPAAGHPVLLVADDGGPRIVGDSWSLRTPRRPVIRLTAFAVGRDEALMVVDVAVRFVESNRPGIARIEEIPDPMVTRDRATGAFLAWVSMPVIVRQSA